MTNTFKRRIYRWCVISAASFLAAFLLYDLEDAGIDTELLIFPCAVLWMGGILLSFKALETWSGWREDTSEDSNVGLNRSNLYPITFYSEATLGVLIVVFLLVFAISRNQPTIAEGSVSFVALVVAGACTGMGLYSRHLQ
jgi:high-affinity Fe2+/Pb2+ permease